MVVPIILGVVIAVLAIGWLITWFRQPPDNENKTVRDIEERLQKSEERQKEESKKIEMLTTIRGERERLAAESERKSKELVELAEMERRQSDERKKQGSRDAKEVGGGAERSMAQREKELRKEKQRLREAEKKMETKERALEEETRIAKNLAETERAARLQMENGLQPTKWPTRQEFQRGRDLIQYNAQNLHFAIVGKSGSGKSSLINAFLNLKKNEPGAAATGVTETTSTIGRYPDPGEQAPRPWTVWYDVPGAGTQNVSAWQYFINQGLFVFDVILIAIGDRFEETDIQLLKDCHRFKIPALIVRSKADMHIDNLVKEDGGWGEKVDPQIYRRCQKTFITESKLMVRNELAKAGLDNQEVYLVSSYNLRQVYNTSLDGSEANLSSTMIDESKLIRTLILRTIQRRHGDNPAFKASLEVAMQGNELVRDTIQAGREVGRRFHAASGRALDAILGQGRIVGNEGGIPPPDYQELQPEQDTGNVRPRSGMRNGSGGDVPVLIKRVLYLPRPVDFHQLQHELGTYNPDLAWILAGPPLMLSPKVVVVNFLPGQMIPDEIEAFGGVLTLNPYRDPDTPYGGPFAATGAHRQ